MKDRAQTKEAGRRCEEDASRRQAIGRTAGLFFSAGAVASVPANQLFADPGVPRYVHAITALAFVSGIVCFLAPWQRIGARWLELIPVLATLEVALTVWSVRPHTEVYSWFYVFVAVFVGYAFVDRRAIAGHLSFLTAAFALPVAYLSGEAQGDALVQAIVSVPTLVLIGAIVAFLREQREGEQRALRELADRDALTGVGNYRKLYERLAYELDRHRRNGRRLAIVLLDLDGFKEVNERLGHLAGDRVLRDVGASLSDAVRSQDTVARQGGDEFSILAPETGPAEAGVLVARVRDALSEVAGSDGPVCAGIGYAIYPDDGSRPETLLAHADAVARRDKAERRPPAARPAPQASEPTLRLVEEAGTAG